MNHGTQSCLSVVGANRVQTSLCGSLGYTSWDCLNSLLSPGGSSQGYLVANRKGVALDKVRGLKAQWQDVADRSMCKEKAGMCHTHAAGECRKAQSAFWGLSNPGCPTIMGSAV